MRSVIWAIGCAIAGFLLGGFAPRRELAAMKQRYEQLQASRERNAAVGGLLAMVPQLARLPSERAAAAGGAVPGAAGSAGAAPGTNPSDPARLQPGSQTATIIRGTETYPGQPGGGGLYGSQAQAQAGGAAASSDGAQPGKPRRWSAEHPPTAAEFQEFAKAQTMRMAAARTALMEQGNLQPQEMAAIDETVKTMNQRMADYTQELADLSHDPDAPPVEVLDVSHRISGALLEGQQGIEKIVGNERLEQIDPAATDIGSFLDLEKLLPQAKQMLPIAESDAPDEE